MTTTTRDDELTTVTIGSTNTPTGYRIPAPTDPKEAARWLAGTAAREAAGYGMYVGDPR